MRNALDVADQIDSFCYFVRNCAVGIGKNFAWNLQKKEYGNVYRNKNVTEERKLSAFDLVVAYWKEHICFFIKYKKLFFELLKKISLKKVFWYLRQK